MVVRGGCRICTRWLLGVIRVIGFEVGSGGGGGFGWLIFWVLVADLLWFWLVVGFLLVFGGAMGRGRIYGGMNITELGLNVFLIF